MFYVGKSKQVIRNLPSVLNSIYLTFDDGPCPEMTPRILDLLGSRNVRATFFVVGARAKSNGALVRRMQVDGHSVHSHSLNHEYRFYFSNLKKTKNWISQSIDELEQLTGEKSRFFRPPAGVLTPLVVKAAEELGIYLILWNRRFFDTRENWTREQSQKVLLSKKESGDIVLLHDRRVLNENIDVQNVFLDTLNWTVTELRNTSWFSITDKALLT